MLYFPDSVLYFKYSTPFGFDTSTQKATIYEFPISIPLPEPLQIIAS